jgi:glycosyltransferase involved in cell wall biosynthesis
MPTFRHASHLPTTTRSVIAQTLTDFELLIRADAHGKDGTTEAVTAA